MIALTANLAWLFAVNGDRNQRSSLR